jgi:hypothetical protein
MQKGKFMFATGGLWEPDKDCPKKYVTVLSSLLFLSGLCDTTMFI